MHFETEKRPPDNSNPQFEKHDEESHELRPLKTAKIGDRLVFSAEYKSWGTHRMIYKKVEVEITALKARLHDGEQWSAMPYKVTRVYDGDNCSRVGHEDELPAGWERCLNKEYLFVKKT